MARLTQNRTTRTRRHAFRPRLDALEERQFPLGRSPGHRDIQPSQRLRPDRIYPETHDGDARAIFRGWGPVGWEDRRGRGAFGDFAPARYNPIGTLDTTFGSGGLVLTPFVNSTSAYGFALAIQPDGKIVVAGQFLSLVGKTQENFFGVARYNTNGTLDTTFGPSHNGTVSVEMVAASLGEAGVYAVAIQPDGKILVGGYTAIPSNGEVSVVVRFGTAGNLDPTFGTGGIVTNNITPGYGSTVQGIGFETLVVNGTPTTEIVTDGWANSGLGPGYPNIQSAIVRYNLNGSLDPTFGTGGLVINPYVHARAIAVLPDGQIVEAGGALSSPTASVVTEFAVARYNTDGSLDTTFNPSGPIPGIAMVGNGTTPAGVRGMAIEPGDGSIIVAGVSEPSGAPTHTALACFNSDGSVNTNFGSGGFLVQVLSSLGDTASAVAIQADGKIVTAGSANVTGGYTSFVVARFLGDPPPAAPNIAAASFPTNQALATNASIAPLVLDVPGFLDTIASSRRRHTMSISP